MKPLLMMSLLFLILGITFFGSFQK
ncbi:Protein of unknown function [Leuconostoc citreum LBAE C10]|nr:Protein of unknown function [Leuconostoc citreum LBAE C10]